MQELMDEIGVLERQKEQSEREGQVLKERLKRY